MSSSRTTVFTPLILIVRFATAIPDLHIPIPSPTTANAATICTLIRPHLPPNLVSCPLRLIYAGALLPSSTSLSTTLRLSPRPPPPPPSDRGAKAPPPPPPKQQQQQLYIHCSIVSDTTLTPSDLENEIRVGTSLARAANASARFKTKDEDEAENLTDQERSARTRRRRKSTGSTTTATTTTSSTPLHSPLAPAPQPAPPAPQQQQPQGFDRLLSAGLSPPEIASLRSHFLAIQAHTHTPDTMPSATELRALEERWLDNDDNNNNTTNGAPSATDFDTDTDAGAGALEDMLWGNVMGFFWAVGAVLWLVREEGVWSKRRQVGVVTGVLVNFAFCLLGRLIRVGGGGG